MKSWLVLVRGNNKYINLKIYVYIRKGGDIEMCDINQISREKNKIVDEIDHTLQVSGSNIILVKKEMEELEKKANNNLIRLSLLL